MSNAALPFNRAVIERYVASRVGQVPEAVAALLKEYDRLRGRTCSICGKGFDDDPENYFRHATGEAVHMTCYERMWEH